MSDYEQRAMDTADHDEANRLGITVEQYRSGKEALKENDKDAGEIARYSENRADVMRLLKLAAWRLRFLHSCDGECALAGARVEQIVAKIEGRTP